MVKETGAVPNACLRPSSDIRASFLVGHKKRNNMFQHNIIGLEFDVPVFKEAIEQLFLAGLRNS